ncbi:lipopolysaccharide biosynthesis protein, partial [Vibrio alginolyticus]|uniref:lipopolysaccharide biosynthesis protein n=1 Tax=Vibrio alginolyticus TaxID=663 RepID=UPI003551AAA1
MKYKFFNYFGSDRPFFRSFMVLFSGNATAQAISIISLPFLTRLYSPEQFGVLALVISISMMLAILLTLRYEVSLVLADYDELKSIIKLISICIVSLIPLAVGCIYLYGFFSNEIEGNITNIVLLSIALAYLSVSNYLLTKFKMFSILSTSRVIQAVFTILFQFILFDLSIGEGLIYGYLLGIGVSLSYILIMSGIRLENVENNNIRSLAVKYIKFPMFNAPQAFLNSMASSAVLFFIGISFGPSFVGFYSLGVRIIQTPMSLISKSISSLTLSELSNAKFDNYEKSKLLEKRTFQLFFICIAFGFFAYLLIPF